MSRLFSLILIICIKLSGYAQNVDVYPTNWWVGMKNQNLQLMLHGSALRGATGVSISYPGITVKKINKVDNANYLFVDVVIGATAKAGRFNITIKGTNAAVSYELKARRNGNGKEYAKGVTSSDFIYLLMPDRFSNGEPSNDQFTDTRDTVTDRSIALSYHGGDIKGIINHLDYLTDLGVTSLWLTPVLKNDMPPTKEAVGMVTGYHGYWITDHYEIDKRYGGKQAYADLVNAAHKKGMKIIQDAVYNHVGSEHWFVLDPPTKDWINHWPAYQGTHHREETLMDAYTNKADYKIMVEGWFTPGLPDLNLTNPYLANFLIQHAIWCTEYFGIDGWRIDTYKYCDLRFMNKINAALAKEFPSLTMFGEAVAANVPLQAFFAENNMNIPFKSNLPGVLDFPLRNAMLDGVRQNYGWNEGVNRIYTTLSQDGLYKNPYRNCIFLDSHDEDRYFSTIGENMDKYKMGINWLFTLRGIPQLYYGTEILMKNFKNPSDGMVRLDFPGGWDGDRENKFLPAGRSKKESEAFDYVKNLANFRKKSSALTTGKLMQFAPQDGLYVYFRYDGKQNVMIATNTGEKTMVVNMDRFKERTNGFTKLRNVVTGINTDLASFTLNAKESGVYEMIK